MDYYSIVMDNVTLEDCMQDYCWRGNRTIINDGKVKGFINEGNNDFDTFLYKKLLK